MLGATIVCFVHLTFALVATTQLTCQSIMKTFYQTEDHYYELGCDRKIDDSEKVLLYRCRFLQKNMVHDIDTSVSTK